MTTHEQMSLSISGEVERHMEERGIGRDDVEKTIDHAEATGEKFVNPSNGRFLASHRPDRVTYWVEYSKVGEGYRVHTAYSHRMEMKRR